MSVVTCGQWMVAVVLPYLSSDAAGHLLLQETSLSPEGAINAPPATELEVAPWQS